MWHLVGLSHRFGRTLQSDNSLPEGRLEGRCQGRCDGRCQGRLKSSETPCTSAFYRPTGGLDETFQNDRFWHARSMTWHHKIIDLAVTRQIFAFFLGSYSFFSYLCPRLLIARGGMGSLHCGYRTFTNVVFDIRISQIQDQKTRNRNVRVRCIIPCLRLLYR